MDDYLINQFQQPFLQQPDKLSRQQIPEAYYYLKVLGYAEFLIVFYNVKQLLMLVYHQQQIIYALLGGTAMVVVFAVGLGVKKKYLDTYWTVFWINYAILMVAVIVIHAKKWGDNALWCFAISGLIMVIIQLRMIKKLRNSLLVLSINIEIFGVVIWIMQDQYILPIFVISGGIEALFFLGVISYRTIQRRYTAIQIISMFFFSFCLFILIQVNIVFFILMSYEKLFWVLMTIVNHVFFIVMLVFTVKKMPVKKIKQKKQQYIYKLSTSHFCKAQDYMCNVRRSIIGKPIDSCSICLSNESQYCYEQCLHACICKDCCLQMMKSYVNKCPMCRIDSNRLIKIKKIDQIKYQIIGKYQFKNQYL